MQYGPYIKNLLKTILSSSLALALILGIAIVVNGETTAQIDLTLDFDEVVGVGVILGLPALSILIFALLSPLSFFIHKLLSKRKSENVPQDA